MEDVVGAAPLVHGNGTSLDTLTEQLRGAIDAGRAALEALHNTHPNGRDYYPEPGRWNRAVGLYEERAAALTGVLDSLMAEWEYLEDTYR